MPGLTDAERRRIEEAAVALVASAVARALDSVQQQAQDVCHTPLSLRCPVLLEVC